MKKNVAIALSILFSVVMIALGTYSYIKWSSIDQNTAINYVVDASLKEYIEYDPGNSQFAGDFKVVDSYNKGIKTTVAVNKTNQGAHVNLYGTLKMTVNEIGSNMAKYEGVKWTVTSKDCVNGTTTSTEAICAEGNFLGVNNSDILILKPNVELSTNEKEFTVWLWVDSKDTPTSSMIHEKVDTEIWMEIGQEITESCNVTQIGANNQIISATGVCSNTNITNYAVTTSSSAPTYWMTIPTTDQNNIYNLVTNKRTTGSNTETNITSTGTYYVWFKDSEGLTFSKQVSVTAIDNAGPVCTFIATKDTIRSGEQTTIKLRCIDENSNITVTDTNRIDLSEINKTTNSSLLTLNSISAPKAISNGVEYTITVTGNTGSNGTVTLTLPASSITNKNGLGNTIATGTIAVENSYSITYNNCNGTKFSTAYSNATPTTYVHGNSSTLSTPTKTGYTFVNYYSTPECDGYTISSIKTTDFGDKKLYAKWSTNKYNIAYELRNGTHGSTHPTSAEYDDVIEISNPSKTVALIGDANGTGATIGSQTSGVQPFIGWGATNKNTSTAYAGTTSSNLAAWSVANNVETAFIPGSSSTFFKNLNPTNNATVTLTANYTPTAIPLPTVTRTGAVCGWNTNSTGTTIEYASGANYTPVETSATTITFYAVCIDNKINITVKENGNNATTTGYSVSLSTSPSSDTATFTGTTTGNTILFEKIVEGTTYYIWSGKSSQTKTTRIYSGVSFTAARNTSQTATINYYGLTLLKGTGISAISNGGTSTTSEIQYLYNSASPQSIAIDATVSSGYTWSTWTKTSGTTLKTITLTTKSQNIQMGAGAATYTANTTYTATPTITRNDYNTFTYSGTAAAAYYVSTSSTQPSAGSTAASSSFALNTWTTATSTGDLTLSAGQTYYVWTKDATTGGNVSANKASIVVRTITRTQGTGTTLTTKYDGSSGTTFTAATSYVLNETVIWARTSANTGYSTPTLTMAGKTKNASGDTETATTDMTIVSKSVDDTPPSIPTYVTTYHDGSGNYISGTWVKKQVDMTISSTDAGSGVLNIQYCAYNQSTETCGTWKTFYFNESPLTKNGTTWSGTEAWSVMQRNDYYKFRACDVAGNCSAMTSNTFNIRYDITAPTISYVPVYADGSGDYTSGTWTNKQVNMIVSSTDTDSGVSNIQYCEYNPSTEGCGNWKILDFNESPLTQNGTTWSGTEAWSVMQRNDYYKFKACDVLGNCSALTPTPFNIRYDKTAPTVSYEAFYADGSGAYTPGTSALSTVNTTITAKDNEVGTISRIQYTSNANATSEGTDYTTHWKTLNLGISNGIKANPDGSYYGTESWDYSIGRNDTFYFRACDTLGNCSAKTNKYNIIYIAAITGTATITGTTTYGNTLTASVTGGLSGATYSYQWQYSTEANGTYSNVSANGTSSTFVISASNVGQNTTAGLYLRVIITGTGNYTDSLTSSATSAIAKKSIAASAIALTHDTITKIYDGDTSVDQSITAAVSSGLVSGDTTTTVALSTSNCKYDNADVGTGKTVTCTISSSGTRKDNYSIATSDTTTGAITRKSITGTATISGTATYGNTLTASVTSGLSGATYSYQWQYSTEANGTYSNVSANGTSSTFVISASNVGQNTTAGLYLRVVISGTNNYTSSLTSAATSAVAKKSIAASAITLTHDTITKIYDGDTSVDQSITAAVSSGLVSGDTTTTVALSTSNCKYDNADVGTGKTVTCTISSSGTRKDNYSIATSDTTTGAITRKSIIGTATISGTATYGNTLTASVTSGLSGATYSYQWQYSTEANGTYSNVSANGTSSTFVISASNVGQNTTAGLYLRVVISGTNNYTSSLTSAATSAVAKKSIAAGQIALTHDTITKIYDGDTSVDQSITAAVSSGLVSGDTTTTVALSASSCTYNSASVGTGKTVTCTISSSGTRKDNYSIATSDTTTGAITRKSITGTATISGTATYGNTLTASVTSGLSSATYSYQWQYSTSASGTYSNVSANGTSSTFVISASNVGQNTTAGLYLRVVISGTNNYTSSLTSAATSAVAKKSIAAGQIALTHDTITKIYDGDTSVDQSITAAVSSGLVSGDTTTTVALSASSCTYNSASVGTGKTVTCTISSSGTRKDNYSIATSDTTTGAITRKSITGTATISGTPTYGNTLTASVTSGLSGATYSYQWQYSTSASGTYSNVSANGTSSTFVISASNVGQNTTAGLYLRVVISGTNNYTSSLTSAATSAVAKKSIAAGQIALTHDTITKIYDGDTSVDQSITAAVSSGLVSGDTTTTVALSASSCTYNSASAGTGKTVTCTISSSGTRKDNYSIATSDTTTGVITNATLSGSVKITGTNTYGNTLTATVTNTNSATLSYQWYYNSSASTSGGTAISGATSSTYQPTSTSFDKYVYVVVTATKTNYNNVTWSDVTDATNNTTAKVAKRKITVTAASNSKVYDGTALTDSGCTLTSGTMAFAHTISSCTMTSASTITNVGSVNNEISTVNFNASSYYEITKVKGTLTVTNATLSGSVKITGTNTYGNTLTATVTNTNSATLSYQWYYNSSASTSGGTAISGATSSTYQPTSTSFDKYVYVVVTATKTNYNNVTWSDVTDATNNTTAKVAKRKITVTAASNSKVYDGTALTDSGCTLTSGTMAFAHTISSCTMTSASTITNVGSVNNEISTVNFNASSYYEITKVKGTLTVTNATLSGSVKITGTNTYGNTLTATVTNTNSATLSYQWYYNSSASTSGGTAISGATSSTYQPTSTSFDKYVYVVVTATKTNYNNVTWSDVTDATNNTTAKVAKRKITVTADSNSKVYDGTALTDSGCTLTSGTMAFTHTISSCTMTSASTITNVGSVNNEISTVNFNASSYYEITKVKGTLTVTKKTCSLSTPTLSGYSTDNGPLVGNQIRADGGTTDSGCTISYTWKTKTSSTSSSTNEGTTASSLTLEEKHRGLYIYVATKAVASDNNHSSSSEKDSSLIGPVKQTYTYTATFKVNGTNKSTSSCTSTTTAASGSCTTTAYTLTSDDYDSATYIFKGWDKVTVDGTKDADAGASITLTGNVTYEAMLEEINDGEPVITFSTTTNATWSKSHSTTVTITDGNGITARKYLWTTTPNSSAANGTSFSSNSYNATKSSGSGIYYLCIYASDGTYTTNKCTEGFYFDNTGPTPPTATSICLAKSSNMALSSFANFTDNASGVDKVTAKIGTTTVTNLSTYAPGSYTVTYTATDKAGNTSSTVNFTFNIYSKIIGDQAIVATGSGLYEDTYTSGRYLFRGSSPNNYLTYNGQTWRILSIETDGTYKIIYDGIYSQQEYHNADSSLTSYDSTTINTYLNSTFYNSMNSAAKNQLKSHKFPAGMVNDGSSSTTTIGETIPKEQGTYVTKYVALPSITDYLRASTDCSDSTKWNVVNKSPYPCKNNNWMYVSSSLYHVLNPYSATRVRYQNTTGAVSLNPAKNYERGVRPTVYLKNTTTFTGSGTSSNPYVVNTNCSVAGSTQKSNYTCTLTTPTGYDEKKKLTITAKNGSTTVTDVTYSFDFVNWDDDGNTKTVKSAGAYTAFIKDNSGATNSCTITLKTQQQWRSAPCAVEKTFGPWWQRVSSYVSSCTPYSKGEAESKGKDWYRTCSSGKATQPYTMLGKPRSLTSTYSCAYSCGSSDCGAACDVLWGQIPSGAAVSYDSCSCQINLVEYSRDCTCSQYSTTYGEWGTTEQTTSCEKTVETRVAIGI